VFRPITLPANMSEISLGLNFRWSRRPAPRRSAPLRHHPPGPARLTYVVGGLYDDPGTVAEKTKFHPGKAVGLDVTVLMQEWIGLKIGVPVYIDPVAIALTLGAPMKFRFGDGKLALGGLDDLVNIRIYRFRRRSPTSWPTRPAQRTSTTTPRSRAARSGSPATPSTSRARRWR